MVEGGEEGEVGYVLDASAIGALLERLGERGLRYLEGAVTLDLALYELGNVLWKACRLRGAISEEEALEGARGLARVLELVERERLGGEDVEEVMALALSLGLTFYDASYLYLAKSRGSALVTEDGDLRERAKAAGVRAIGVEEYLAERERDRARKR
jgi:predicted nucleic acid-binding protein